MNATVTPIRPEANTWWLRVHSPAEVAASIEQWIVDNGRGAWIELQWIYRTVDTAEIHAFIDDAVHHLLRRNAWLDDAHHARSVNGPGDPAVEAEREDQRLHDLIDDFVRTHTASQP